MLLGETATIIAIKTEILTDTATTIAIVEMIIVMLAEMEMDTNELMKMETNIGRDKNGMMLNERDSCLLRPNNPTGQRIALVGTTMMTTIDRKATIDRKMISSILTLPITILRDGQEAIGKEKGHDTHRDSESQAYCIYRHREEKAMATKVFGRG
jgi:hypothetical protein